MRKYKQLQWVYEEKEELNEKIEIECKKFLKAVKELEDLVDEYIKI